jgi:hypothetical protein
VSQCLSLLFEGVIASKTAAGRPKDLSTLPILLRHVRRHEREESALRDD